MTNRTSSVRNFQNLFGDNCAELVGYQGRADQQELFFVELEAKHAAAAAPAPLARKKPTSAFDWRAEASVKRRDNQ